MELKVNRLIKSSKSTQGVLEIDGKIFSYTMEPATPITAGMYEVITYASPKRNGAIVPMLKNVPGHSFIEIHIVNKPEDTRDCLGLAYGPINTDWQSNSGAAIKDFYALFLAAIKKGKVFITYIDLF